MEQKKREIFCPQCGNVFEKSAKYCPECGFNLDGFYASAEKICAAAEERERQQNYLDAAYLYRFGAQCGHAVCMYRLGLLFERGLGIGKNLQKAIYCHSKAAALAYLPSVQWLFRAYSEGGQAERDDEKALGFLRLAAELGDEEAAERISRLSAETAEEEYEASDDDEDGAFTEEDFDPAHGTITDVHGEILHRAFVSVRRLRAADADKNAIKQEETEHLAFLRERMKEQIRRLDREAQFNEDIKDVRDLADLRVFQAGKERAMNKREKLGFLRARLDDPYFGRMLLESGGGEQLDLYIGQDYFMLGSDDRLTVYSHNAPVPAHIYDRLTGFSYEGIEYTVLFKRRFDIRKGQLVEVFQSYLRGVGQDEIVYDRFLARILERKKNDKRLTDIIPTIQENQTQIITRPRGENLIVQGCAGCGKTMILLQRLEFLAFRGALDLSAVTVIVPSEEFKQHIAPVIHDLRLQQVRLRTVTEFYLDVLSRYVDDDRVRELRARLSEQQDGDADADRYYYSDAFYETLSARIAQEGEKWAARVREFEELNDRYQDGGRDFANRSEWIKGSFCSRCSKGRLEPADLPYLSRRFCAKCREAQRPLTFHFENIGAPERPKLSLSRYGVRYGEDRARKGCSRGELYAETLMNFLFGGAKKRSGNLYEGQLICIDEGQDLDPNEYRLLRAVCGRRAAFNIFGDIDQRVDPSRGVDSWSRLESIGTFSCYELNENYRNTQEVTAFINERLQKRMTPLGIDGAKVLSVKEREIGRYLAFQEEGARVAIIISGRDAVTAERLAKNDALAGYVHTVEQCKGLEFDAAVIFDGDMTYNERYISYSRTLGSLYLVSAEP